MKEKVIFHMDGDAFFVAVEIAKNPRLRGLPVITGEERGIVSALSYEAKAIGITRGMPIFHVKRNFPKVIILPGDYKTYAEYSEKMFDIVRRYADDVEEYSIDECFADLTGLDRPLKMSYREIGERIQKEIKDELDLSVSVGIAPTKVLAKVASKWIKPNGLTVIEKGNINEFLSKVPVDKIWGIGRSTSAFLYKNKIHTASDFTSKSLEWIRDTLARPHEVIWNELKGISLMMLDPQPKTEYSSVQRTRSFHPSTNNRIFLLSQLSKHTEDACAKARHYHFSPKRISIFLKTRDFRYYSTCLILPSPTNAPEILLSHIQKEFEKIYNPGVFYRTTGITLHELIPVDRTQSDLFGNTKLEHRFELIHKQIDLLEEKYGRRLVYLASTHHARSRDVIEFKNEKRQKGRVFEI
ncbi:MAG: DNA polymerase IV [Candidatus Taylorbacteria bacterium]|nr:DNA polymerase IV [Candidatus Taylorbacteria bacterium]